MSEEETPIWPNTFEVTIGVAIRDWMHNALGATAVLSNAPCTKAERAMLTACPQAMEQAETVLWEVQTKSD